jgi:DNA modification methylase
MAAPAISPRSDVVDQHWETLVTFYNKLGIDEHWDGLAAFYNPKGLYRGQNRVGTKWAQLGVWDDIPGTANAFGHGAVFPVEIPLRFISLYGEKGEVILEPFCGSGTTMIAAEKLGRRCFGMELDPLYCDIIRKRWAEFVHGEDCKWEKLTPQV